MQPNEQTKEIRGHTITTNVKKGFRVRTKRRREEWKDGKKRLRKREGRREEDGEDGESKRGGGDEEGRTEGRKGEATAVSQKMRRTAVQPNKHQMKEGNAALSPLILSCLLSIFRFIWRDFTPPI
jgi:hypothetical protein